MDREDASNAGLGPDNDPSAPDAPTQDPDGVPLSPEKIIGEYLAENVAEYCELSELRKKGWETEGGDRHFKQSRRRAYNADHAQKLKFFKMTVSIGTELDKTTKALTALPPTPRVLDLGMAPGGFSASVLARHPDAHIRGISLPASQGGVDVLVPGGTDGTNDRIDVRFLDITMLAGEMGLQPSDAPASQPDAADLVYEQPWLHEDKFDIVFCGAGVLRTYGRASPGIETRRLRASQLVMGLQRVKPGGTLVLLMHRVEALHTAEVLQTFDRIPDGVKLFKPRKAHSMRSSFYMVAKGVKADSPEAREAVEEWRNEWAVSTFSHGQGPDENDLEEDKDDEDVEKMEDLTSLTQTVRSIQLSNPEQTPAERAQKIVDEFGEQLIKLGRQVWKIQASGLKQASFMPGESQRPWKTRSGGPRHARSQNWRGRGNK